ncbi:hypothetical protein CFAM422_007675 [Trichoderma lentiforme]|uniref:Uncharacterized protein n=1 Tax=Trichoderma lentiforme TaxID=1567552 RepID=A0A9P4XD27_9HYPO|nr:hypothetical protein CFAM422_007675 [Trichoderma lentiforme]
MPWQPLVRAEAIMGTLILTLGVVRNTSSLRRSVRNVVSFSGEQDAQSTRDPVTPLYISNFLWLRHCRVPLSALELRSWSTSTVKKNIGRHALLNNVGPIGPVTVSTLASM